MAVTATAAVIAPFLIGAASASAEPVAQSGAQVAHVGVTAPATITRGAEATLAAKVTIAGAPVRDRSVQFLARAAGASTWQVLGSATTGADGTTTLPVQPVDDATDYAAYYADGNGTVRSETATTTVHVIDVKPVVPATVGYDKKVTLAGQLVKDGEQGLASQPLQVRFRPAAARAWSKPTWLTTDASGTATLAARFTRSTQVAIQFPGSDGLAPSPVAVATVKVGPKPAVSADGFRFPFLDAAGATAPSTWSLDQGVDMFMEGMACGPAAKLVAVGDGTVVQTGISGFGPTAPVIQLSSGPFKGRDVYYGHTGQVFVHPGQQVKAGDVIAEIGCGRVGISSAPHLEIGVGVPGGPPCCPGWGTTAAMMMKELVASLRGA